MRVRFADCTLDVAARRLFKGPREVHISPRAFALLLALVDAKPRALSKSELLESVWRGVFVSEDSVAKAVAEIRAATGDEARIGRIVRTVHRYGYAFAAVVTKGATPPTDAPSANLYLLTCGGRDFPLTEGRHVIGRDPYVSVSLDSPKVSRRHACITLACDETTIEDLGSKNGTFVGALRISATTMLRPGDEIAIGPFTLVLRALPQAASTETDVLVRRGRTVAPRARGL
jgi:DNA-binding winged helix-turn-helix (wHTH) protein